MKTIFSIGKTEIKLSCEQRLTALLKFKDIKARRLLVSQLVNHAMKTNGRTDNLNYVKAELTDMRKSAKHMIAGIKGEIVYYRTYGKHGQTVKMEYINGSTLYSRKDIIKDLRLQIQRLRKIQKQTYDTLAVKYPNAVVRKYNETILEKPKKPTDNDKYIGVEIECIVPADADMTSLVPFGKWVNVGTDGSISDLNEDEEGRELRVCLKRNEVRDVLPRLLATLNDMGARVNKTCGLHVHLDQRNNTQPDIAFKNLVRSLSLLYTVVPKTRRENTYCKRNHTTNFDQARNGNRYKAINASAYYRYKTLEVRLFGGTW